MKIGMITDSLPGTDFDNANRIATERPPEVRKILRWQWDEVLVAHRRDLVGDAKGLGLRKLGLERTATGTCIACARRSGCARPWARRPARTAIRVTCCGCVDPVAAVRAPGDAICHVHAKHTCVDPAIAAVNGSRARSATASASAPGTTPRRAPGCAALTRACTP